MISSKGRSSMLRLSTFLSTFQKAQFFSGVHFAVQVHFREFCHMYTNLLFGTLLRVKYLNEIKEFRGVWANSNTMK